MFRAINDLVEAKIVDMDPSSGLMKALPEAHHMTKHVVKFKTMKLLMAFDINYDLKQVHVVFAKINFIRLIH
jgi:hypothetical protein